MQTEIIRFVIILAPFFSDFTILLIIGLEYFSLEKKYKQKLNRLILYLFCTLISSSSFLFYFYFPKVFAYINPLVMFGFIMAQVFFYNFVFQLTILKEKEKFSKLHYIVPSILSITLLILSLTTPLNHQVETIVNKGVIDEPTFFNLLSNAKFPIRLIFSLIYTILSFIRLIKYQKNVVNYSSNYEKSSLRWLVIFLILSVTLIPIPLLGTLLSREKFSGSWFTLIQIFILIFQYAFITFHVLKRNYTVFDQAKEEKGNEKKSIVVDNTDKLKKQYLTKELIDDYFKKNKPYLDCNLKLSDLVLMLKTNRSYLSSFINSEYKMNFSKFINSYRLNEYYNIKKEYKDLSDDELVEKAGFGSYKNFLRYIEYNENNV